MADSIFDRIIRREIPADIVHEDEHVVAFRDISPQAPVHVLFVPRQGFRSLDEVPDSEAVLLGRLLLAAAAYARREGFPELWVPKAILVVPAVPVLASGKIDLQATTEMARQARPAL